MTFRALAPPGTVLVPLVDQGQPVALHPREAALVARAADRRRRDFALGRMCAHAALDGLGCSQPAIGRARSGAPLWPQGVLGSITHTHRFAAALAARAADFRAIGIDAERTGGVDDGLAPRLFVDRERALLDGLDAPRRALMATLLFSAKEAYYKMFHPLAGRRLDFRQVEIVPGAGTFTARQPGAADDWARPVAGRFAAQGDLVVTAIWLAAARG